MTAQSARLNVQVEPGASGSATSFNFTNCEANQMPVWFAVQNASGPWTRVTPTNNTFTFTIATSGAIAMVVQDGASHETSVT